MEKFVVAVFPDQAKAYEGTRALKELQAEGSLSVYAMAVLTKAVDGTLSVHDKIGEGPAGTAIGALLGGLVGLLGGPAGGVAGFTGGGLVGSYLDLFSLGVEKDFLNNVSAQLTPGKSAVVAEVDEEWIIPLDKRVRALGGTVLRQARADFEDEEIKQAMASTQAELDALEAEYRQAREEDKAALEARIKAMQATLRTRVARSKEKRERLQREAEAKIAALREQAANARADAQARREQRIAKLRADYARRTEALARAAELMHEALAPSRRRVST